MEGAIEMPDERNVSVSSDFYEMMGEDVKISDVQNVMETLVEEHLDKIMDGSGVCTCDYCRADIKALALNKLPARYASRLEGNLITRVDNMRRQASTDVIAAIMEAVNTVGTNPRHEPRK